MTNMILNAVDGMSRMSAKPGDFCGHSTNTISGKLELIHEV